MAQETKLSPHDTMTRLLKSETSVSDALPVKPAKARKEQIPVSLLQPHPCSQ